MNEFPADAPGIALAVAVPGDAVADAIELTQLLDVHVDHFAGAVILIADHRRGRLQIPPAVQAMTHQGTDDGGA